jgi:hypothetical protein
VNRCAKDLSHSHGLQRQKKKPSKNTESLEIFWSDPRKVWIDVSEELRMSSPRKKEDVDERSVEGFRWIQAVSHWAVVQWSLYFSAAQIADKLSFETWPGSDAVVRKPLRGGTVQAKFLAIYFIKHFRATFPSPTLQHQNYHRAICPLDRHFLCPFLSSRGHTNDSSPGRRLLGNSGVGRGHQRPLLRAPIQPLVGGTFRGKLRINSSQVINKHLSSLCSPARAYWTEL